jgi:filamentous hemagglutinin family protein
MNVTLKVFRIFLVSLLILNIHIAPVCALDVAALPSGAEITSGSGSISTVGNSMTVNQYTPHMIAEWDSFNIGESASVAFVQPNASSIALNRIFDASPTQIFGSLSANGQVFLLNAAGIIFGPSSHVDVAGIVASSLNLSDEDFLSGRYAFQSNGAGGMVLNQGIIETGIGGYAALLAPDTRNEGTIHAPQGSAFLGAGDTMLLDFTGDKLIHLVVERGTVDALIENKGLIDVGSGLVVMNAKAADTLTRSVVNQEGTVEAKGISLQGGRILLDAHGGDTNVSGTMNVSSLENNGGTIVTTGDQVLLIDTAELRATGGTGGGEIYVGGGWQGQNPAIRNAEKIAILSGALLDASATDIGDGGTVVAWSDVLNEHSMTHAYGEFLARGGVNGGDGGRIETSGHWLDTEGIQISAHALNGINGSWLLDPNNVSIQTAGPDANIGGDPAFATTNDTSILTIATLLAALDAGTNVSVTTGTSGANAQGGDITIANAIANTADNDATLTLNAHRDISVNAEISSATHELNLVFNADSDRNNDGAILVTADIGTNGGDVQFGGSATYDVGTVFGGAGPRSVTTNGGAVDFYGDVLATVDTAITTNNGAVTFHDKLDAGNTYSLSAAATYTWAGAVDHADNVANSYLITITSALENSLIRSVAAGNDVWTGAYLDGSNYWRWMTGPEGQMDGGQGLAFSVGASAASTIGDAYTNWTSAEPNASGAAMQIWFNGGVAKWDDTTEGTQKRYIRETEGTAAAFTIDAGAGVVTFAEEVGSIRALGSLNVTSTNANGIAINGGAVTTEGVQTYTGNVTLGSVATTLTQTTADTDFTVVANKSITNAYGNDASLTIKTTGSIIMDTGSSILSSIGGLDTILWTDTDNNASGYISIYDGNTISTNGGDIVMAGGLDNGASGRTAGDGRPDGFATATATYSGVSIGRLGTNVPAGETSIQSDGGDIFIKGKSTAGAGTGMGINYSYYGTLDAGDGSLMIIGESSSYAGIELSAWLDSVPPNSYLDISADTIHISGTSTNTNYHGLASSQLNTKYTRMTAGAGGIYLYGNNTVNTAKGVEVSMNAATTGGGNITVESPNYIALYAGTNAHNFNAGTGNTTIKTNTLSIGANHTLLGTGALTVTPYDDATTIGVAGGAGTLSLSSDYFLTNFVDGFSSVTIGSATAGAITVGGAVTLNDDTTFKNNSKIDITDTITMVEDLNVEAGNGRILVNGDIAKTSGTDATLTLKATSYITTADEGSGYIGASSSSLASANPSAISSSSNDLNVIINPGSGGGPGGFWLSTGSTIDTNGGDLTIGGGADPASTKAMGVNLVSYETNSLMRGVALNGAIDAKGGNIIINGQGSTAVGFARGVHIGANVATEGSGTITIAGEAQGSSDGVALSNGALSTENGTITLTGVKDSGANGINLSTAGSSISTTGTGNVILNATGNVSGTGSLVTGGTTTITAGTGTVTLTNSANNFNAAVSLPSAHDISIYDSDTLILGAINSTGTITVSTGTGNITLTDNVQTTNATNTAIVMNANPTAAAGTAFGGNVIVSGGSVSVGAGGRATLYSGSVSGSTGLSSVVGSGSGNFRYNSDESVSNFLTALGSGVYGIYREQPSIAVTAIDQTKMYDGVPFAGGNGVTGVGIVNGDTLAQAFSGDITYTGSSQGALEKGSYVITPAGYTSLLGYGPITYIDATLVITKLTVLDEIFDSVLSIQPAVNGTQETGSGTEAQPTSSADILTSYPMGPGSGSNTLSDFSIFRVVQDRTLELFDTVPNVLNNTDDFSLN